jgi:hypothetical protein
VMPNGLLVGALRARGVEGAGRIDEGRPRPFRALDALAAVFRDRRHLRGARVLYPGHQDVATTQRYMHLSPAAVDAAIRLLDEPTPLFARGDIVETGDPDRTMADG